MVVLDRGMGWEVSQRVLGCRWWWSEGVLPVICDCVGGVFVGGGWLWVWLERRWVGCCPGCRWWCLIANAWRVSGGVWIRVLLMMREWYVAGRCCAGGGWCCAMAWIFLVLWVSHIRSRILQIQSDCRQKMLPFHAIGGLCWYNYRSYHQVSVISRISPEVESEIGTGWCCDVWCLQKLGNVRLAAGDSQAAGRYPQSRTGLE